MGGRAGKEHQPALPWEAVQTLVLWRDGTTLSTWRPWSRHEERCSMCVCVCSPACITAGAELRGGLRRIGSRRQGVRTGTRVALPP